MERGLSETASQPVAHGGAVEVVRPAFSSWSALNRRLVAAVADLDEAQLAFAAGPNRWPLWAVVGHHACQRVFWLCDFAGLPGAAATRFTEAPWNCPGDDDLEHALSATELVDALTSTVTIVERALDGWTLDSLSDVLRQPEWGSDWSHTRGAVLQRVHDHDTWHTAEVNEILSRSGLPLIDLWS